MALPASGEISINDINVEFGRSGTTANSSLEDLSSLVGVVRLLIVH